MGSRYHRIVHEERGGVAVIIVISSLFIFGMLAMAIDGGQLYSDRRTAQNAADHAAYAAAWAGCNAGSPSGEALAAAARNGFNNDGVTNTVTVTSLGANTYHVAVRSFGKPHFSGVIGNTKLSAVGEASARNACGAGGGPAVFGGSTTCSKTVDWSGSTSVINGSLTGAAIHSNRDVHVSGSTNSAVGQVTYALPGGFVNAGSNNVFTPGASQSTVQSYPVSFTASQYAPGGSKAAVAQAAGRYRNAGNAKIDIGWLSSNGYYNTSTKILQDGVYYTTGEIDLSDSGIRGPGGLPAKVTLVSTAQKVKISGSNQSITPWDAEGLLALTERIEPCGGVAISFSGSTNVWAGIVFSPNATIDMSGSDVSSLVGNLIGKTIKIAGSNITLTAGSYLTGSDNVELVE